MASDTASLGVVNFDGSDRTQLVFLDIEEAGDQLIMHTIITNRDLLDVVSCYVNDCINQHRISDLTMKPLRLVQR